MHLALFHTFNFSLPPHVCASSHFSKTRQKVTHVRLTIFPDGGVMRLRVIGRAIAPMGQPLPAPAPAKL